MSPNQLDEKIEHLGNQLTEEVHMQKEEISMQMVKTVGEIERKWLLKEQEMEAENNKIRNLKEDIESGVREIVREREEGLKDVFEQDKQEFLKAIQENMQMLD